MAEETENLTISLLQEMRGEIRDLGSRIGGLDAGLGSLNAKVDEMRDDLTNRIDGNTVILNMLAGLLHDHEQRIVRLEDGFAR